LINARKPIAQGCVSLLKDLAERYQLALASSGSRASVEAFLDLAGCRDLFRSVLNGDDVEFEVAKGPKGLHATQVRKV